MTSDVPTPVLYSDVTGWRECDLQHSLAAFQRSAQEILGTATGFRRHAAYGGLKENWIDACTESLQATDPHQFFETYFRAFRVTDRERPQGLFTGYYEPLVKGSRTKSAAFPVPVYNKPRDLVAFTAEETAATGLTYGRRVDGRPQAYDTRRDIENGSLDGKVDVICWLSDWVDTFFMHVQGQGRVQFENGEELRLSYSGKAGHPYTGIGHALIQKGVAPADKMSMQVLRDWMRDHPADARELMWTNKSYIFFQATEVLDSKLGGIGAAKVNLTPLHSLAVDRAHWMFGTPLWIETNLPPEVGGDPIKRLMIGQDTGSAIKGIIRGDFYWGWGDSAELIAGNMKSAGAMTALLPLPLAKTLGHA
jgi:membrane-bound lytic murein transglycosylase A